MNIIATFFVLELHSSQAFFYVKSSSSIYLQTKLIQIIFIPAVLLFFMISGAMLLDYRNRQSTITFLKKRFFRVVIPLFSWSVIWYVFDIFWAANPGPMRHLDPSLIDFIKGLFLNNINNIFWFFYIIIALYLVTPIFSQLAVSKKYNLLFAVVCVYFFVNCILVFFVQIFKINIDLENVVQPLMSSSYLGYFLLGYLIHKNYFNVKQENLFMVFGFLSLMIALFFGFYAPSLKTTSTTGLLVFLYSAALMICIKRISGRIIFSEKWVRLLTRISATNLGVYLMHPFFIKLFDKIFFINENNWIHIYLFPFLVYIVCVGVTLMGKKIPIVKYIFP
ncbi:acyltransferase 3 [Paucilactobacillus hokkaidonensis]|uniref:Acyltransferase 3 n=1 Tax=Paucilactobacillus hokkaidonensis TaxID=1193095 RepID=A0ABR5Q7S3_9LACO|nr:acyltransferase 3 [Paucilactobacillus hokkaidonensis]